MKPQKRVVGNKRINLIFTHPSQTRESILILEWGKHSLSFSVFHEPDNRILTTQVLEINSDVLDILTHDLDRIVKDNEIFSYAFQKVICLFDNSFLTLVPHQFIDSSQLDKYLKFTTQLPSGNFTIQTQTILSTPYEGVFALPSIFLTNLSKHFPNIQFSMSNISLLNYFARFAHLENLFTFHINQNAISFFYYKGNQLLFFNSFPFISDEDILYHLTNVMNTLQLNIERELIYFSGEIVLNSSRMQLLEKYCKYLKPLERSNKLNYASAVDKIPSHYLIQHYANCL